MKFKKRHSYKPYGLVFEDDSRTQQQFKDECDCCKQIARLTHTLEVTGKTLADYNNNGAMYGDFTEVPDFATYNKIICDAKERFELLDPKIRERFNNSPEALFNFVMDDTNRDEAIKLGLVNGEIKEIKETISVTSDEIPANAVSSSTEDTPI